jgi:hypothetical protein
VELGDNASYLVIGVGYVIFFIHIRYDQYSMYYYNDECSIYREHKVTIHERMRPFNNQ